MNAGFLQTFQNHLELQTGDSKRKYYFFWLRDNCRCKECYNTSTNQISYDLTDLDFDVKPNNCFEDANTLNVTWNDGHKSKYSLDWLKLFQFGNRKPIRQMRTWNAESIKELGDTTTVDAEEYLSSNEGVKKLLQSVLQNGFGIVKNVDPTLEATKVIAERVGFIQKTFFKEMHDLLSGAQFSDTAYTNIPLGAHTDNTYFTEAAGIQVFHLLSHDGTGGETVLVDGFNAINNVEKTDPEAFKLLCDESLEYHYIEEGVHYSNLSPIIKINPYTKELEQIRYNVYDRAPLASLPDHLILPYYRAYRRLGNELRAQTNQHWLRLRPGNVLFIDNWRVMHGRAGFTGQRRLGGCYLGRADWLSKCRTLGLAIL